MRSCLFLCPLLAIGACATVPPGHAAVLLKSDGVSAQPKIVAASLSPPVLEFERIQQLNRLAASTNAKTVVIGPGATNAPVLLSAPAPSPTPASVTAPAR